jgi:glycosyltransferase involved in cell wall biosynthesis
MTKAPDCLLIVLTFNHEECISEAINSLLNQDYKNFKILIIDDKSSDKTWEILNSQFKNDDKIILMQNRENLGGSGNFNFASTYVMDKYQNFAYFSWIGPDDTYSSQWLGSLREALEINSNNSIAQSYCTYDFGDHRTIYKYEDIREPFNSWAVAKKIHSGYGQLLHGLWTRQTMELFADYKLTSRDYFFRLESFSICYLLQGGNFVTVEKNLMVKRKDRSSNFRYPNDPLYSRPTVAFLEQLVRTLPIMIKCRRCIRPKLLKYSLLVNLQSRLADAIKFQFHKMDL